MLRERRCLRAPTSAPKWRTQPQLLRLTIAQRASLRVGGSCYDVHAVKNRIETLFRDVIAPLFEADGASVELVHVRERLVQIRFGGAYRGCPSTPYMVDGVIVPALRKATGHDYRVEILV